MLCIKVPGSGEKLENSDKEEAAEGQGNAGEESVEEQEKAESHSEQLVKGEGQGLSGHWEPYDGSGRVLALPWND